MRQWKDDTGRVVEAAYVKVEGGLVHLRLATDKVVPFPFSRLSQEDQEYVRKLFSTSPENTAKQIDAFVNQRLAAKRVTPNPKTTDSEFVRRVYLEITGSIPTFEQAADFLDSTDPQKRRKLIDSLIESEEFVMHSFNWYADMLRLTSRTIDFFIFEPYHDWVKESIAANKPYDQMVREMLSAEGGMLDNPAAGYHARDRGMKLGNLSTTATVFLGTEITCAECHDHPFEDWTQLDFYQLAAFVGEMQYRPTKPGYYSERQQQYDRIEKEQRQADSSLGADGFSLQFRQLVGATELVIHDDERRKLTIPENYAYDDAEPGSVVTPKVLFGTEVDPEQYPSARHAYAAWLTGRDNPFFTKAIVNRLWKRAFGLGLYEPLGNIGDVKKSQNPELFLYLEKAFQDMDFDVKEFMRVLYYTDAWQRRASLEAPDPAQIVRNEYHFPGPLLKRMTAEQLWDSFLTLSVPDPLKYRRQVTQELGRIMEFNLSEVTGKETLEKAGLIQELLGKTVANGAPSKDLWVEDFSHVDPESGRMVKFAGAYLARSSEIVQPAPPGHFLRAWGQSDRSVVDGSSDNGSIPQILTMINGPFTQMLIKPDSHLFKKAGEQRGTGDKMDNIYLSILSRRPEGKEKAICSRAIRADDEGYADLIWALVNTREFIFIR